MKVRTLSQAARYIDQVGYCLLFPIKGLRLPSLWAAVKGKSSRDPSASLPSASSGSTLRFDRASFNLVAAWDDDALRLWEWKDLLPRRRLVPAATPADAARLFGWPAADARAAFALN